MPPATIAQSPVHTTASNSRHHLHHNSPFHYHHHHQPQSRRRYNASTSATASVERFGSYSSVSSAASAQPAQPQPQPQSASAMATRKLSLRAAPGGAASDGTLSGARTATGAGRKGGDAEVGHDIMPVSYHGGRTSTRTVTTTTMAAISGRDAGSGSGTGMPASAGGVFGRAKGACRTSGGEGGGGGAGDDASRVSSSAATSRGSGSQNHIYNAGAGAGSRSVNEVIKGKVQEVIVLGDSSDEEGGAGGNVEHSRAYVGLTSGGGSGESKGYDMSGHARNPYNEEDDILIPPPNRPLGPEDATYERTWRGAAEKGKGKAKGMGKGKAPDTTALAPALGVTSSGRVTRQTARGNASAAQAASTTAKARSLTIDVSTSVSASPAKLQQPSARGKKRAAHSPPPADGTDASGSAAAPARGGARPAPGTAASRAAAASSGTLRSAVGAAMMDEMHAFGLNSNGYSNGAGVPDGATSTTTRRKRAMEDAVERRQKALKVSATDHAGSSTSTSGSGSEGLRSQLPPLGALPPRVAGPCHDSGLTQQQQYEEERMRNASSSSAYYSQILEQKQRVLQQQHPYQHVHLQQYQHGYGAAPLGVASRHLMTTGGAGELWPGAGPSNAIAGSSSSGGVSALRYRQRLSPGLDDVALGSKRGSVASIASPAAPSPPPHGLPVDDAEGHFIVRPGDSVTARYKILSQLGQGTFGKVVECYDRSERRRVAIKVIRAIQKYRDASQIEIRVLRTLRQNDPNNENQCIHLLSTFSYRNHVCIVSELLGKSVFDFLKENEFHPFPSTHIWSFAKQLLKSVAFLHSLNLVHTDLKPENILLVDSDYVSKPYSSRYPNSKKWRILKNTEIRLIDFGSATFDNEYHSAVVSTRHYRAPEIILGMGWSFPCDVWSIGCILVEFHTGDALFQTHDNLEHLAMMEAVLGMMPDDFRRKAETYKADLFKDGHLDYPNAKTSKTSKKYVRGMRKLSDTISYSSAYNKHNTRFLHLLRRLLEFDPDKRITVEEALSHPYFSLHANDFPA